MTDLHHVNVAPIDESGLLANYLNPNFTLVDICERHDLPLPNLLAWAELPATADLLTRLKRLADTRSALLAAEHAPAAITTLSAASSTALAASLETSDPNLRLRAIESARRSTAQLLRFATRRPARQAPGPEPAADPPAPDVEGSPEVVAAPPVPEPSFAPDEVSSIDALPQAISPILNILEIRELSSDPELPSLHPTEDLALPTPGP